MEKQRGSETTTTGICTILSVSPHSEDHSSLETIMGLSQWRVLKANNIFTARALLLQQHDISVVFSERDLNQGTWIDILKHLQSTARPAPLIVTSRLADESLWSEVLRKGGWDLLAKPLDCSEVVRSVRSAWQHWHSDSHVPSIKPKVMTAAS